MKIGLVTLTRRLSKALVVFALVTAPRAYGLAGNAQLLCKTYPTSPFCTTTGKAPCTTCHWGGPPVLHSFGDEVLNAMRTRPGYSGKPDDFAQYLEGVLLEINNKDSDEDGYSNGDEINRGYSPGDSSDHPSVDDSGPYDFGLALKRIQSIYCGVSPTFAQNQVLQQASDKLAVLHQTLDTCLASDYWKKVALPRLADEKIRPVRALGSDGNPFILGDYNYDYRLFTYVLTDNRDARMLLTADFHIAEDGHVTRDVIPDRAVPQRSTLGNGQPLQVDRRAGMVTTQWFIAVNTMFADLPRNTAAQAYRAYLGLDIAKSEGLYPISQEPRDVDNMRVGAQACAVCHSTLDPLAYPFSPYIALKSRRTQQGESRLYVGSYDPKKTQWEKWGYLFGEPVMDLMDWSKKAANSDAFKVNLAKMFYHQALGREAATTNERSEFATLWQSIPADGYSMNKLLHRLIATKSFGAVGPSSAPVALWKRHAVIAHDLQRGLQLSANDFCQELGQFSCTDNVFLTTLGGNDPFAKSQYRPSENPGVTTPVALERVALNACSKRVMLDAAGTPKVFTRFKLDVSTLVTQLNAVDQMNQDLYRLLLGRDANSEELNVLRQLTVDDAGKPVSAKDVATLSCFTIATSREFAFY